MIASLSETVKVDGSVVRYGNSLADEEGALCVKALSPERDPRDPVARSLSENAMPRKAGK